MALASGKLSKKVKIGYGIGDLGGNLFFTIVAFWLMNYLTDEVGLSAALAGTALMIARIVDAGIDPVIGVLSDRTRTRIGRRRPWMLVASFPLGAALVFLFTNPHYSTQTTLFIWATIAYSIACIFYACVNIPYSALTPELTKDFDEKTSVNGYRMSFAVVGTLTGAGLTLPVKNMFTSSAHAYQFLGILWAVIILITALIPVIVVKEPRCTQAQNHQNVLKQYADAFRNRPFLLILIPYAFNILGVTIVTASMAYYFKYVIGNEGQMTLALLVMLVTSMIFIPICVKVSEKIGKKGAYILGMSILSVAVVVVFIAGHLVPVYWIYIFMFFAGMGFSSQYVMPYAMIPDTIEYDYMKSGIRREGIYYSLWIFTIKIGQALAGLFTGLILFSFGYVAERGAYITEKTTDMNTTRFYINNSVYVADSANTITYSVNKTAFAVACVSHDAKDKKRIIITNLKKDTGLLLNNSKLVVPSEIKAGNEIAIKGKTCVLKFEQKPVTLFGIRLLMGPFTVIFFILANIILIFYPISKKRYLEIVEKIKEMESKEKPE